MGNKLSKEDMALYNMGNGIAKQRSVFGGTADAGFYKPDLELSHDGLEISYIDQEDMRPRAVMVEFPELVAIRYMIPPHIAFQGTRVIQNATPWGRNGNHFFPQGCRVAISPQEANNRLEEAVKEGYLSESDYNTLCNHCAKVVHALRQQQGR